MRQGVFAATAFAAVFASWPATGDDLPPVLTADTVAVVQWTGQTTWPAYEQTVSFRAFHASGLVPALMQPLFKLNWPAVAALSGSSPEDAEIHRKVIEHLWQHGVIVAAGLSPDGGPIPYGLVIIPQAGEWALPIFERVANSRTETDLAGRKVFRIAEEDSGQEFVLWNEAGDLVFYAGPPGLEPVLQAADGGSRLATSDAWKSSGVAPPGAVDTLRFWLNFGSIVARYGETPVPVQDGEPIALQTILKPLGLDQWTTIAFRSGPEGEHIVSEWNLNASAPPAEWLGWQSLRVTLADLPPLPEEVTSFSIQAVDLARVQGALQSAATLIRENPDTLRSILDSFGFSGASFGVDPAYDPAADQSEADIVKALGHVVCIYQDRRQLVLPWGFPTVAISVKDRDVLIKELDALVERQAGNMRVKRDDRWGCPTYVGLSPTQGGFGINGEPVPANLTNPTLAVCENWLVIALQPQTVQTFILRSQGKLPTWTPDQIPEVTRGKIPPEFVRLAYSDPRPAVSFVLRLAPWLSDALGIGLAAVPGEILPPDARKDFSPLDIPAAEVVTQALFPNVSITECRADGIRHRTFASTTLDNPVYWGVAGYLALAAFGVVFGNIL